MNILGLMFQFVNSRPSILSCTFPIINTFQSNFIKYLKVIGLPLYNLSNLVIQVCENLDIQQSKYFF